MPVDEQLILSIFKQLASQDMAVMDPMAIESCFSMEADRWLFTLPRLFEFLQYQDPGFAAVTYNEFRRLLFNCPINEAIRPHDAEIVIIDNRNKVDHSTYAMVWRRNSELSGAMKKPETNR